MAGRKLSGALLAVALVVAAGGGAYWYMQRDDATSSRGASASENQESRPQQRPVTVETEQVEVGTVERTIQAVGSLRSRESIVLRPESSGRIAEINFTEGTEVERGQLLFAMDSSVERAELAQSEARQALSRVNFNRANELLDRQVGTQRTRDEALSALRVAEAEVALARARLDRLRVVAPFDGLIGLRSVSVGDYVTPGQELVNLEDISTIKVDFRVPEPSLPLLHVGQQIGVTVDAFPGERFRGAVSAIDPLVDVGGRSVVVRAEVPNDGLRLRPGLFARVSLIVDRREDALLISEQAIVPRQGEMSVFRVVDGRAVATAVRIGQRRDARVEILEGLEEGDVVVTAGQMRLRDGVPVQSRQPGVAASSAPQG